MNIEIILLADLPEKDCEQAVNVLAIWNFNEWHKYDNTVTIEGSRQNFIKRSLNKDNLPLTLIAIDKDFVKIEDSVVGMVTLKKSIPVPGYDDKTPWLGSLLVLENYRNNGIGTKLVNHANRLAIHLGFKEIFLFTSNSFIPSWYSSENRGWEILNKDTYPKEDPKEHQITIMKKKLILT